MTTLLIDNYDSFTYNVYQYLCSQGADVVVYRNDKITIEEIEKLAPRNIVISPGPGHPAHDAGISRAAIDSFAGKIPNLGICMGLQCMFEVYGGTVSYAGDIMHGKASTIKHDSRGVFKGVPQNNQVTRYHSLAGMPSTIPDSLEVTATTDDGVIMGVRHKEYTVEGVQFHPESILCENGHTMIQNFLKLEGGTWEGNPGSGVLPKKLRPTAPAATATEPTQEANTGAPSILTRIYAQRVKDVQAAKEIAGQTMEDLEKLLQLHVAPPLQDVVARIRHQTPALLAEVKRASPSKGNIDVTANAAKQALDCSSYATVLVCDFSRDDIGYDGSIAGSDMTAGVEAECHVKIRRRGGKVGKRRSNVCELQGKDWLSDHFSSPNRKRFRAEWT